ncbi:MAG TPA: glycoside hydrolase family 18 protein [Terriglobales bacterium]|nr:glycoside hydrolase family 18 protein [Terriglobales bacterium]
MKTIVLALLLSASLFGQWITGFYSAQNGVMPVSAIPWSKYTHINHFAASTDGSGNVLLYYLSQPEINTLIASRPAGKKVLVTIKDNDSNSNAMASSTASGTLSTFVNNIVSFVNSNGYDGVDIDWEHGVNVSQYESLLTGLRSAMPGKVIATDVGNWSSLQTVAAASAAVLDQINVMCYDMDTPGNGYSWYNDALLQNGNSTVMTCDWRVGAFTSAGVPASKVGVGIPFYGRRWPGVMKALVTGSFSPSTVLYRDLVTDSTRWQSQYQFYDSGYKSNYLSISSLNEFDSYNGAQFFTDAVAWGKSKGFGGYMTFTTEYEYLSGQSGDAAHPLSTALYSAVFGGGSPPSSGPTVSGGSPTGTLSSSTTSTTLSVVTNVNATCKYATVAGMSYASMPFIFSVTGGSAHSTPLTGLLSGTTYNYYVRCEDISLNVDTTDYLATFSVAAVTTSSAANPFAVTPNSGSGSSQAFAFQVSDSGGYAAVTELDTFFDTAVGNANSCRVQYGAPNILYLQSNDMTAWYQGTVGSSATLQNSQCSVNLATSSVSGSGTTLTVTMAISFSSTYTGTRSIFAFAADSASSSGWKTLGSWTVTDPPPTLGPPTVSVSPNSGSGSSTTFSVAVTDGSSGFSAINQADLFIGNTVGAASSCYIDYNATTSTVSLQNDAATGWSSATPGSAVTLQNSQCSVNAGLVTVSGSGNTLTLKVPVAFTTSYTGTRTLYTFGAYTVSGVTYSSGWQNAGSWTVSFGHGKHH